MMKVGSLFAGIGGLDLGLQRAGFDIEWQVEIDPGCRRFLEKHWPGVRRHDDIRMFPPTDPDEWKVDLVCGGFPCQDISNAGRRAGIDGERSGLWSEFARVLGVLRPRYVLIENVAALVSRGLSRVLADLASLGFDAEWDVLSAQAFGAPHLRERLFVVAYPNGESDSPVRGECQVASCQSSSRRGVPLGSRLDAQRQRRVFGPRQVASDISNSDCERLQGQRRRLELSGGGEEAWDVYQWLTEPAIPRVAHGIPNRMDRLRGIGNAVMPVKGEWLGNRIKAIAAKSEVR